MVPEEEEAVLIGDGKGMIRLNGIEGDVVYGERRGVNMGEK